MSLICSIILLVALITLAPSAQAVCPVCTVAVGVGLGFFEWLGIDDTIGGVWIGGLMVSLIVWTNNWLTKKRWTFPGSPAVVTLAYYAMVVPVYFGIIEFGASTLWGIDRLLLGTLTGSIVFYATCKLYEGMKAHHGGHAYFPFQKVAMPVGALGALSLIFYLIIR